MDSSKVTAAKPKVGGAVYVAPEGTTLPANSTSALASAFVELGYASEDGLSNSSSPESDVIKAWGGDTVCTVTKGRGDEFSLTLIEAVNVDVLKLVYGSDNVSGTLATGIAVAVNAKDTGERVFVMDMILRDNATKRIVIPRGRIAEVGEVKYSDSSAVGYQIKIRCEADSQGNSHYEYIKEAESSAS